MNAHKPQLISIVGPTAVGKTAFGIELAKEFNTEIISADSRQFYREMDIGTAKPTNDELSMVPHHFVNSHSINEYYSAGVFEREVMNKLEGLFETSNKVLMVGGSGLYTKAVCEGFDEIPEVDESIRKKLNAQLEEEGLDSLLQELEEKDPMFFDQVDRLNHQRVIRALEVIRSTGRTFVEFRQKKPTVERPFENVKIGLEMDREKLYERIDNRMDRMIEVGLFEEAERLYPHRHLNALQTVGYREIFDFIDGKYDREEAVRLLKRNSRRYAKRQMTWFKADPEIKWFDASNSVADILVYLQPA
ncbi:MAG: tRNA (adenosine(37)-N6)-dimethylallyltransferase MiaA [Cytophagales bacterium]|nr:tRNA (adenosine(37)-N6)-dimethylallyltransferase MiaA [Cytophagales bacterium]